jgi:hypothetical protein
MKLHLSLICALLLSGCTNTSPLSQLSEGDCTQSQQLLIKDHVSGQIDAIADQNWQKAYSFAAKSFQESIGLERFTQIISEQYVLLITNKGYTFDSCEIVGEQLVQKITVSGAKDDFRMTYRLTFEEERLGVVAAAVTQVSEDLAT